MEHFALSMHVHDCVHSQLKVGPGEEGEWSSVEDDELFTVGKEEETARLFVWAFQSVWSLVALGTHNFLSSRANLTADWMVSYTSSW